MKKEKRKKSFKFLSIFIFILLTSCNLKLNIDFKFIPKDIFFRKINEKNYQDIYDNIKDYSKYINEEDYDGNTALLLATKKNNIKLVDFLIKNGAYTNVVNKKLESAINIAIISENRELIELLIDKGVYNFLRYNYKTETFDIIINKKDYTTLKYLFLKKQPNPYKSFLEIAIELKNKELIEFFLENNEIIYSYNLEKIKDQKIFEFVINKIEAKNINSLSQVEYYNFVSLLITKVENKELIENFINRTIINDKETNKNKLNYFLNLAIINNKINLLNFILKTDININYEDSFIDYSLLVAINSNNNEIIDIILEKKPDINLVSDYKKLQLSYLDKYNKITPLMLASEISNFYLVKKLLNLGANVNLKSEKEMNALNYSFFYDENKIDYNKYEKKEIIKILLEKTSDLSLKYDLYPSYNSYYEYIKTPINQDFKHKSMVEIILKNLDFLELVLNKNPVLFDEVINKYGSTPLIFSIIERLDKNIIEFIAKNTKNINAKDNNNKSALDYVKEMKNEKLIDILKQYNAKD